MPPLENSPPPLSSIPPLPSVSDHTFMRQLVVVVLSVYLGLFITDAFISLAHDSLMIFFNLYFLAGIQLVVSLLAMLMAVIVYILMAITPMIPKRLFLPIVLFNPATQLFFIPFLIYCYNRLPWVTWGFAICQVLLGLWILYCVRGGLKVRWPLVSVERLGKRGFSWLNLCVFVLANIFVLLPAMLVFLIFFTAVAVSHFSDDFMALRDSGITVQMRKYIRDDGKTIELFPMAHVADANFYRQISHAFPTNSIILMEGVTDKNHLLANPINYRRMARSLGLTEQHVKFTPGGGKGVRADVDISSFSTNTLNLLNLVMLIHNKGLSPDTIQKVLLYPQTPALEEDLYDDLLKKRNQHLFDELNVRLTQTDCIVIPWGVAHMPGIARQIQKEGFHPSETNEYMVIRFHGRSVN
jgi:hypothetical protein